MDSKGVFLRMKDNDNRKKVIPDTPDSSAYAQPADMGGRDKENKQSSSQRPQRELVVNSDYWYEEQDIQTLLAIIVNELQPAVEDPIFMEASY